MTKLAVTLLAAVLRASHGVHVESDQFLYFEIEETPSTGDWEMGEAGELIGSDGSQAYGTGYYDWIGKNRFKNAGLGLLAYPIEIVNPEVYTVSIRNFHGARDPNCLGQPAYVANCHCNDAAECNDIYIAVDDGAWEKSFSNIVGTWNWMANYHREHENPQFGSFTFNLTAGAHTLWISGRSNQMAIDAVMLHTFGPKAQAILDGADPVTGKLLVAPTEAVIEPPTGCTLVPNVDFSGFDLAYNVATGTAIGCAELCVATPSCTHFTFIWGGCYPKTSGEGAKTLPEDWNAMSGTCSSSGESAAPTTATPTTAAPTTATPTTTSPTTGAPNPKESAAPVPDTAAPTTAMPTTAAPATEAPVSGLSGTAATVCTLESDSAMSGSSISAPFPDPTSAENCGNACAALTTCGAYTFTAGNCDLKASAGQTSSLSGAASGVCDSAASTAVRAAALPQCTLIPDTDLNGNDLAFNLLTGDFEGCAALCLALDECTHFTFIWGKCYPKTSGAGAKAVDPKHNAMSGACTAAAPTTSAPVTDAPVVPPTTLAPVAPTAPTTAAPTTAAPVVPPTTAAPVAAPTVPTYEHIPGCCRVAGGGTGTLIQKFQISSGSAVEKTLQCKATCDATEGCVGYERIHSACEIHGAEITHTAIIVGCDCYRLFTEPPTPIVPVTTAPITAAPHPEVPPTTVAPVSPTTATPTTAAPVDPPTTATPTSTPTVTPPTDATPSYSALNGCCRTASGGTGTYIDKYLVADATECQADCDAMEICVGYEMFASTCELHSAEISFAAPINGCSCFVKNAAPTTAAPTEMPTAMPTVQPSMFPTAGPTSVPTSPTTGSPTTAMPTTETPTTGSPTTGAPTTAGPTTQAPTTAAPTTGTPTTAGPTTQSPTTAAPTTGTPTTATPTTEAPTTAAPTTGTPTTAAPTTGAPTTGSPTTAAPVDFVQNYNVLPGCCRTTGGGTGTLIDKVDLQGIPACQATCDATTACVAFEYHISGVCERHSADIAYASDNTQCSCHIKVGPPTTAAPTSPTSAPVTAAPTPAPPPTVASTYIQADLSIANAQTKNGPGDFREAQGAAKNGKLYVFGGFENGYTFMSKKTWSYNPSSNSWQKLADIPMNGAGITHMGNAVDPDSDMIYLTGGLQLPFGGTWITNAVATNIVVGFNTKTNSWTTLPSLPELVGGCGAAVLDGKLHVIGGALMDGQNGGFIQDLASHWVLDLSNKGAGWSALAPISQGRNHIGVAVGPDNKIYAIGGQHLEEESCSNYNIVEAYDAESDSWELRASLPHGIGHISPAILGTPHGLVIVSGVKDKAGGCGPPGTHIGKIHHYDPAKNKWTSLNWNKQGASMVSGIIGDHIYAQHDAELFKTAITWTNHKTVNARMRRDLDSSSAPQPTSEAKNEALFPTVALAGLIATVVLVAAVGYRRTVSLSGPSMKSNPETNSAVNAPFSVRCPSMGAGDNPAGDNDEPSERRVSQF